jgi:hypothetical protein
VEGKVGVYLIDEGNIPQAHRMMAIGLAGGEGRGLEFEKDSGSWKLTGISRWIG